MLSHGKLNKFINKIIIKINFVYYLYKLLFNFSAVRAIKKLEALYDTA